MGRRIRIIGCEFCGRRRTYDVDGNLYPGKYCAECASTRRKVAIEKFDCRDLTGEQGNRYFYPRPQFTASS